jgi:bidirectional [NiFe] hydrogenase diaphorase subunit
MRQVRAGLPHRRLFHKGSTVSEMERDRGKLEFIVTAREKQEWVTAD